VDLILNKEKKKFLNSCLSNFQSPLALKSNYLGLSSNLLSES